MLNRQSNALPLVFVELEENSSTKIFGIEVFLRLEDMVFDLLDENALDEEISEKIESFDSHDSIYSQFRCFYLAVNFISEYLCEEKGFSVADREKYYNALINFTEFSQIKIMSMFLQFMASKYDNVRSVKDNKDFEKVFLKCGLSFEIYKK